MVISNSLDVKTFDVVWNVAVEIALLTVVISDDECLGDVLAGIVIRAPEVRVLVDELFCPQEYGSSGNV